MDIFKRKSGWGYTDCDAARFLSEDDAIRAAAEECGIDLPDWDTVRAAYGLDGSFQYSEEQVLEYTSQYIKAEFLPGRIAA